MDKITTDFIKYIFEIRKVTQKSNVKLPSIGEKSTIDLVTTDLKEKLFLDINRKGRIELKVTIQNRYKTIPIVRIDIDSPPHMHLDGTYSSRNHIHLYNAETKQNETYNLEELEWFNTENLNFLSVFDQFCSKYNIDINIQGVL